MRIWNTASPVLLAAALAVAVQVPTETFAASTSTTTLTAVPNPSELGETVRLQAIVSGANAPTGTVTFKDGAMLLGDVALDSVGAVRSIATKDIHTCALTAAGGVKCWGYNANGQVGRIKPNPNPFDVTSLGSGIVAVEAGSRHTCALTDAGVVKCWGLNDFGQLGNATNIASHIPNRDPADVTGLSGVVAIAAGIRHTCALTNLGKVKCWGSNHVGQLGRTVTAGTDDRNPDPRDVRGLGSRIVAIAAGPAHTCALTSAGGVRCWGHNRYGQLGNATNTGTDAPNPVPLDVIGLDRGVVAIAAGVLHTCALTSAGGVKCWGYNGNGQLGRPLHAGSISINPTPLDVTGLGSGVAAITAGGGHTCALTLAGGVKCWGYNSTGQIGNATNVGTSNANPAPLDVTDLGSGIVAVAAGGGHTCTVTNGGAVKCFGSNLHGELGNRTNLGNQLPNPAPLDVTGVVVAMVAGRAALDTAALEVGQHTLTAEYGGDADHDPSTSDPLTHSVQRATTSVVLESSANPSTLGQPVTFTATVSSDSGTPTGKVVFLKGGVKIATGTLVDGVATLTTTALRRGTHDITAQYQHNGGFQASISPPVQQEVVR